MDQVVATRDFVGRPPAPAEDSLAAYVARDTDGTATLHLMIENLHCAGCVHRIETALAPLPGVVEARVNLTAKRLRLRWTGGQSAADFVARLAALGYRAVPFDPGEIANARASEEKRLLRCLAVAGFAATNVMLLSVAVWAGAAADMTPATRDLMHWLSALVALPAIAWAGRPFYASAFAALRSRALNMDVPISLAVALTAGMSLWETARGGPHAYFDAAVALLFFLLVGRYLDSRARGQARSAAERLAVLGAAAARVIDEDGRERLVPARSLMAGMVLRVAPGDRLPADGQIDTGESELDSSLLTGETLPKAAKPGDVVYAGTMNLTGALTVTVTASGEDTVLAEIVRLVEAAEGRKGRYVRLADRAARLYAPLVHLAALSAFAFWVTAGGLAWQPALLIAVSVLIVTCPCALGLAVPAAQAVASGRLLRAGILVKRADALERVAAADTVVFDKTGTLTLGTPRLIWPEAMDVTALYDAARLAAASRHPLCRALVAARRRRDRAARRRARDARPRPFGRDRRGRNPARQPGLVRPRRRRVGGAGARAVARPAGSAVGALRLRRHAAARRGRGGRCAAQGGARGRAAVGRPAGGGASRRRGGRHRRLACGLQPAGQARPAGSTRGMRPKGADGGRRAERRAGARRRLRVDLARARRRCQPRRRRPGVPGRGSARGRRSGGDRARRPARDAAELRVRRRLQRRRRAGGLRRAGHAADRRHRDVGLVHRGDAQRAPHPLRREGAVTILAYLIPIALVLGLVGLAAFLWALKSGQFDDLDGAASRILYDDPPPDRPR